MVTNATDSDFEAQVLKSDKPVLVDFWAEWCHPCRVVSPLIDKLGAEYKEKVKVVKVNVDENPQSPSQYGVMSIPTVILFKNGQPVKTMIGVQSEEDYKKNVEEILGSPS